MIQACVPSLVKIHPGCGRNCAHVIYRVQSDQGGEGQRKNNNLNEPLHEKNYISDKYVNFIFLHILNMLSILSKIKLFLLISYVNSEISVLYAKRGDQIS